MYVYPSRNYSTIRTITTTKTNLILHLFSKTGKELFTGNTLHGISRTSKYATHLNSSSIYGRRCKTPECPHLSSHYYISNTTINLLMSRRLDAFVVVWGSYGSLKVIGNVAIRYSTHDYLIDFNRNVSTTQRSVYWYVQESARVRQMRLSSTVFEL